MQELNKNHIKINIQVEALSSLSKDAFNNTCFIFDIPLFDSEFNYEEIELNNLEDIIDSYAENIDIAYKFAESFFAQKPKNSTLYLRGKDPNLSYIDSYNSIDNNKYYFISIESKDIYTVLEFNDFLDSELKLQFFSSDQDYSQLLVDRKIVYFYYNSGELPPVLSCEGATNLMSFSQISGVWEIYVDDMENPSASGTIGSALAQLSLDYSGRILFDYDGFAYIQNQENIPHRIKFVPISATNFTANNLDNPTFTVHEDGSLTFCLASVE